MSEQKGSEIKEQKGNSKIMITRRKQDNLIISRVGKTEIYIREMESASEIEKANKDHSISKFYQRKEKDSLFQKTIKKFRYRTGRC